MSIFNTSINAGDFKAALQQQTQQKTATKRPDSVPYFKLEADDPNSTIRIRLLPVAEGSTQLWYSFDKHTGKGKSIRCSYESSGASCKLCTQSYAAYQAGDKETQKLLNRTKVNIGQALILQSSVPNTELKVMPFYLTASMIDLVTDAIQTGQVENPTQIDLVLRKTKNKGGWNAYDKSFWDFKTLNAEIDPVILEGVELIDLSEFVPAATTSEQTTEFYNALMQEDAKPF